jgi:hypothetical protein
MENGGGIWGIVKCFGIAAWREKLCCGAVLQGFSNKLRDWSICHWEFECEPMYLERSIGMTASDG